MDSVYLFAKGGSPLLPRDGWDNFASSAGLLSSINVSVPYRLLQNSAASNYRSVAIAVER